MHPSIKLTIGLFAVVSIWGRGGGWRVVPIGINHIYLAFFLFFSNEVILRYFKFLLDVKTSALLVENRVVFLPGCSYDFEKKLQQIHSFRVS